MSMLLRGIAQDMHNRGIGVFTTTDPALRTIYIGDAPDGIEEYLSIISLPSPSPHEYIDTEYPVVEFTYRSPHTDRAHDKMEQIFEIYHRRYHYELNEWLVEFSRALGTIVDGDRDQEGGKLYRLSVQFICRNLNHIS